MGTQSAIPSVSDAYWAGAADGRLVLQRCSDCGLVRHYPRVLCNRCYSFAVTPFPAEGVGTLHSWTVAHHAFDPSVTDEVPYVLATVDLIEGVRLLARFKSFDPPSLGLEVRVQFESDSNGHPRPVVVPATE